MVPVEVVAIRGPVLLVVEDEVLIRISVCDFLRVTKPYSLEGLLAVIKAVLNM
jgi:hypothetical protein